MNRFRRVLVAAALVVGVLAATSGDLRAENARPAVGGFAYFTEPAKWQRLLATPGLKHIVLNVTYGDSDVKTQVELAQQRGIMVYGYADAGYAPNNANAKTLAQMQTAITSLYSRFPTINGVFVDEVAGCDGPDMPASDPTPKFYIDLRNWILANHAGAVVVLNPGTALCSAFRNAGDVILAFENTYNQYGAFLDFYASYQWMREKRLWMVAYGVPKEQSCDVVNNFVANGGSVVWTALSNAWANPPDAEYLYNLGTCADPSLATTTTVPTTTTTSTSTTTTTTTTTTTKAPAVTTTQAPVVTNSPNVVFVPVATAPAASATTTSAATTTVVAPTTTGANNPAAPTAPAPVSTTLPATTTKVTTTLPGTVALLPAVGKAPATAVDAEVFYVG